MAFKMKGFDPGKGTKMGDVQSPMNIGGRMDIVGGRTNKSEIAKKTTKKPKAQKATEQQPGGKAAPSKWRQMIKRQPSISRLTEIIYRDLLNKDVEVNLKNWRKGKPIVTPSKTQRLVEKMQDANEPKAKKVRRAPIIDKPTPLKKNANEKVEPQMSGDTRKVKKAKRITRKHVGHTTVDSPTYGTKKSYKKFPRSEKKMIKAIELLRDQGYSEEDIEQFTGAGGHGPAMDWATEPGVTKGDRRRGERMMKKSPMNKNGELRPTDKKKAIKSVLKVRKVLKDLDGNVLHDTIVPLKQIKEEEFFNTKPNKALKKVDLSEVFLEGIGEAKGITSAPKIKKLKKKTKTTKKAIDGDNHQLTKSKVMQEFIDKHNLKKKNSPMKLRERGGLVEGGTTGAAINRATEEMIRTGANRGTAAGTVEGIVGMGEGTRTRIPIGRNEMEQDATMGTGVTGARMAGRTGSPLPKVQTSDVAKMLAKGWSVNKIEKALEKAYKLKQPPSK